MSVLRNTGRRLALGLALAALFVFAPVRPAAADPGEGGGRVAGLWEVVMEWVAGLWGPVVPAGDPVGGGGEGAAVVCRGDEGMCIDPNG